MSVDRVSETSGDSEQFDNVDIAPDVSVLGVFRHLNYQPWFAVAEFVDNALDSYISSRADIEAADGPESHLRVRIEFDSSEDGKLIVSDNAGGISRTDWGRALRPAEPPPDTSRLSEFGMGMKTAACWFAHRLTVQSKALSEGVVRTAELDFDAIVANRTTTVRLTDSDASPEEHGTVVILENLHKFPQTRTVTKIRDHLGSIYREFIRSGDLEIIFKSGTQAEERLQFDEVDVLSVRRWDATNGKVQDWKKPLSIDLGDGKRVTGFAALRARGSTSQAGFALLRRGRLIQGSGDDGYRPRAVFGASTTAVYQRLFGELDFHGFDVTHTKDGIRWDELEDDFTDKLRSALETEPLPLLTQARRYQYQLQKNREVNLADEAELAAHGTVTVISRELPSSGATTPVEPDDHPPPQDLSPGFEIYAETRRVEIEGESWEITAEFSNDLEHAPNWIDIAQRDVSERPGEPNKLRLRVSLRHPFSERFAGVEYENLELLIRFGAALVLAEIFAKQSGASGAGEVRRRVNSLLRTVFAMG